jgi:hypothetical protein
MTDSSLYSDAAGPTDFMSGTWGRGPRMWATDRGTNPERGLRALQRENHASVLFSRTDLTALMPGRVSSLIFHCGARWTHICLPKNMLSALRTKNSPTPNYLRFP